MAKEKKIRVPRTVEKFHRMIQKGDFGGIATLRPLPSKRLKNEEERKINLAISLARYLKKKYKVEDALVNSINWKIIADAVYRHDAFRNLRERKVSNYRIILQMLLTMPLNGFSDVEKREILKMRSIVIKRLVGIIREVGHRDPEGLIIDMLIDAQTRASVLTVYGHYVDRRNKLDLNYYDTRANIMGFKGLTGEKLIKFIERLTAVGILPTNWKYEKNGYVNTKELFITSLYLIKRLPNASGKLGARLTINLIAGAKRVTRSFLKAGLSYKKVIALYKAFAKDKTLSVLLFEPGRSTERERLWNRVQSIIKRLGKTGALNSMSVEEILTYIKDAVAGKRKVLMKKKKKKKKQETPAKKKSSKKKTTNKSKKSKKGKRKKKKKSKNKTKVPRVIVNNV